MPGLNRDLIFNLAYALIATGVIIILCTIGSISSGGIIGTMVGYSCIATGILVIAAYILAHVYDGIAGFFSAGPLLMIVGTILFLLSLLGKNIDRISTGNTSGGYYTFSNICLVLIMLQLIIFYDGTTKKQFQDSNSLSKVSGMGIYLLGVINIISANTLGTILSSYITDG